MSQLSVKYGDPEMLDKFYFFTRDIDFKKVTIYQDGKIIKTLTEIENFQQGISFHGVFGEEVTAKLLNKRDFTISVSVDGDQYISIKDNVENDGSNNVKRVALLFAVVLIVQLINVMYFSENKSLVRTHYWSDTVFPIYFAYSMTIPVICYAITVFLLFTNRGWPYFIAFPMLLAYTGIEVYNYYLLSSKWNIEYPAMIQISILIRIAISLVLLTQISRIVRNLKNASNRNIIKSI